MGEVGVTEGNVKIIGEVTMNGPGPNVRREKQNGLGVTKKDTSQVGAKVL